MKIKLENHTIGYYQFLKLFAVGWVFGVGLFLITFSVLAMAFMPEENGVLTTESLVFVVFVTPAILFVQSPIIGSMAYVGIILYRRFKGLSFE